MSVNLINYALAKKDWEKAYEDLKVLGAGGRNLLRNSDFSQGTTWWIGISEIVDGYKGYKGAVLERSGYSGSDRHFLTQSLSSGDLLTAGETYTLSGWFYIDSSIPLDSKNSSFYVRKYHSSIAGAYRDFIDLPVTLDEFSYDTWYYFKATGTVPEGFNGRDQLTFALGKNGRIVVSALKLEKGNKATDWTPAPEDINAHPFVAELAETVFRSKQQDWEKAYEDLKVLGVGGRNLLRNSDFSNGSDYWEGQFSLTEEGALLQSTVGASHFIQNTTEIPEGDYIVQIWYEVLEGQAPYLYVQDSADISTPNLYVFDINKNYISFPIKVKRKSRFFAIRYASSSPPEHLEGKTLIKRIKIEKGNKATDWTPAPEDIDAHPFVAELAETVYRSKQNEERIRNLENAITALGGGS